MSRRRVLFIGSGEIGLPALEWLREHHDLIAVVAQPDKPVGRKQVLTPPHTKEFALRHAIATLQPERIRQPEAVAAIAALEPELIIVMAYGQILPKALLELAPLGCLNLHASLLPKYRGAAPIQAAIEAGEKESGITVIWMDEGLDTGDMLCKVALELDPQETGGSLHDRLAELSPEALARAFDLIGQGNPPRERQQEELASYAPKLSRSSGVIDWSAPAEVIERRVRAMNPWPAASTTLPLTDGSLRSLKVFSVGFCHESPGDFPSGTLMEGEGMMIATGTLPLMLEEVQLEGKKRMSACDLRRGTSLIPGTRLGNTSSLPL